ncbi:MAG TPA: diacylglycerol kinase family protein [Polyangiaceae bacterium]
MTVDLVVNRNARRLGTNSPLRVRLVDAAERGGARVHETRSLEELDRVAREMADRGSDAVVLAGGDGSHMGGVSALARAFGAQLPRVAFAPGGTVSTVARNLVGASSSASWGERLVRAVCDGTARARDVPSLRVRDDAGGDRVGFIFGAGLVAHFFDVYDAAPQQGIGPAARIAGRVFLGSLVGAPLAKRVLAPVACALEVDGDEQPARAWSLVLASVVRDVGLGVRATYRAGESFDRFHVVASTLSARRLATQVPRVLSGRPMHSAGHAAVDAMAHALRLRFEQPEASYVLDGDALRAQDVRVEAGPVVPLLALP